MKRRMKLSGEPWLLNNNNLNIDNEFVTVKVRTWDREI